MVNGLTGEDDMIARYFAPLAGEGANALRDDCAVFEAPPDRRVVVTLDTLVADVHFFADDPPEDIARKALRVNLSDLAGKGATPFGYLLSLSLNEGWTAGWLEAFVSGLACDQKTFGCSLLGGDTTRTPGPLTLSVTAFGHTAAETPPRREMAKPGERLFVTGTVGDAGLGLLLRQTPELTGCWGLTDAERDHLLERYRVPQPRMGVVQTLGRLLGGAMDISDGLALDSSRMGLVSGTTPVLLLDRLPLSTAARTALSQDPALIMPIVSGGDDYELLFSSSEEAGTLAQAVRGCDVSITEIGYLQDGAGAARLIDTKGQSLDLDHTGYRHF